MILVSAKGVVRFWESMSLALSNVDRYQEVVITLGEEEVADNVWMIDVSPLSPGESSDLS